MAMLKVLRPSSMLGMCDECRASFDPVHGGVCSRCNRLLCGRHIYGSFFRRLQSFLGTPLICTVCRTGATPKSVVRAG
jgi:hypothetical protein